MLQVVTMGMRFLKKSGLVSTFYRSCNFVDNKVKYNNLCKKQNREDNAIGGGSLHNDSNATKQSRELSKELSSEQKGQSQPKISVLVPLYRTPEGFLRDMIASVTAQTYENWELCLADGTAKESQVTRIVKEYQQQYPDQIRYEILKSNDGISANTNAALALATGDYVCLLDHDDVLTKDALSCLARTIEDHADADSIYTDEDKMDKEGKNFFNPRFKPDFNIDYLRSNNYICHLFCTRTEIARAIGGFHNEFDGSQDYDFILRCSERSRKLYHIPKVLYHWRYHEASTAARAESKLYAYEAGQKAVEAHYERLGYKAKITMPEYGYYISHYELDERPWITVLVHGTANIFGPVGREGSPEETKAAGEARLEQYKRKLGYDRIHLYKISDLSFQTIHNILQETKDNYVLFCDERVQKVSEDGMTEMLGYLTREDVGVTACRTIDSKNRIYHCGIIMGLYGSYGFSHRAAPARYKAYYGRTAMAQNVSAVDATVTLMKKSVLLAYLDQPQNEMEYAALAADLTTVQNQDGRKKDIHKAYEELLVDLCLTIQRDNCTSDNIVVLPYVEAVIAADAKKANRLDKHGEHDLIYKKWRKIITNGDPFYNPNLSRYSNVYKIRS